MVLPDDEGDGPPEFDILQNFISDFGMALNQFEFDLAQMPRLVSISAGTYIFPIS